MDGLDLAMRNGRTAWIVRVLVCYQTSMPSRDVIAVDKTVERKSLQILVLSNEEILDTIRASTTFDIDHYL